mmetsp:Transcript_60103/g.140013  ORF Transcript_60103/g.140013 Transcript_60103/m.140013 type:complete len:588 (-) Transcript_60103:138-1901(-)
MERLAQLECRLEKWNQDQQSRIEQVLHNRHVTSVRSAELRVPPVLQRWGCIDKGLMPPKAGNHHSAATQNHSSHGNNDHNHSRSNHHYNNKHHAKGTTCQPEEAQPEREQSPLQEEEAGHTAVGRYSNNLKACPQEKEVKHAVREWVVADASDIKASRKTSAEETRVALRRSRSSTFLMLTSSSDTKELVAEDARKLPATSTTSCLSRIVSHPAFDYFFATMIVLNALFIGVQTEYRAIYIDDPSEPQGFGIAEKVFAGLFFVELAVRMIVMKLAFFSLKHLSWNMFDLTLVLMSVIEVVLTESTGANPSDGGGNVGKVIRMFRMARIIRIMRVVRFLAELRIMVTLIIHSVRSLIWLMVLLVIILYVFSIFFTQGVTDYLIEESADNEDQQVDDLKHFYGGLANSAYTLFTAITGGISWADVVSPLLLAGWTFKALFIVYVFFCVFSVLNIVTGVFVDGAIQRSAQERDLRLEKEKEQKKMYVTMLMDLLEEIDKEGTGTITRSELEEAFQTDVVRYSFSVLDIDIADSNYLFDMLDLDGSGEVDMEEFVSGCLRLKGNAKSIDIHTLMFEVKHLMRKMDTFMMDR